MTHFKSNFSLLRFPFTPIGYNPLLNWAFGTAEDVVHRAVTISAPLVHKFDRPLQLVDQTVVKGIDRLEVSAPIIKEQPQEIYNQAKSKVLGTVKPYTEKVCELRQASQQKAASLKELSWKKANEVLATQYGSKAVNGVDTTAQAAERLLDYYFPKSAEDVEDDNGEFRGIWGFLDITELDHLLSSHQQLPSRSRKTQCCTPSRPWDACRTKLPAASTVPC